MKSNRKSVSLSSSIANLWNGLVRFVAAAPIWAKVSALTILYALLVLSLGMYASQVISDNPLYINSISYAYGQHLVASSGQFMQSAWDTTLYASVVQNGYDHLTVAFFPLYPLLGSGLGKLLDVDPVTALNLISIVASILLAVVLYHWARFEFKTRKVKASPWLVLGLVAIFPTALYLFVPYSESLFMLLTAGAFFAYRKENYWLAALLAFLSAMTRPQGLLIGFYFFLDYLFAKNWKDWKKLLPAFGAGLGLLAYMMYLWYTFGNPLEFLMAQQYWGRLSGDPVKMFALTFDRALLWYVPITLMGLRFVYRYLDRPMFWYSLAFVLFPVMSGSLQSVSRYILTCLPLFLGTAMAWYKLKPAGRGAYIFSCGMLLMFNVVLFFNFYWVA